MTSRVLRSLPIMLLTLGLSTAAQTGQPSGYHVIQRMAVGGEGGWDYLTMDSKGRRLYISRGTHVMVVDPDAGTVVGDIPNTPGVHGIAVAPEFGKGFTSNGRDASVTIFDLKTLKTLDTVKVGQNPDAIIYDPASKRVFTFNGRSQDATAVDAQTGKVAGTIPLGGKPEFAVADERGRVFVNIEDKSELVTIDSRKLAVETHSPLAPCEEPSGIAMDRGSRRLFVGCGGNQLMAVVNADSGRVITTLPIGKGVDANGFDPETKFAFSSNGDGTLTIVREEGPDKFSVVENVPTERGARTMALDRKTHRIYLATAKYGPAPPATAENPRPRGTMVPGSFVILVVGK